MTLVCLTMEELAAGILSLSPGDQQIAAAAARLLYGTSANRTPEQIALELDWQECLRTLFPRHFRREFSEHHENFWRAIWSIELGKPADPEVDVWPRGHGKSTNAEAACAIFGARGTRRYGWYLSEIQEQADDHVGNVAALLESKEIREHYPQLGERLLNKFGTSRGWKRNRIRAATGFTVDALGLDKAKRGVKLEEQRPDFIIIDDVDGKHDSPQVTQKKIEIITTSILPAGSTGDLFVLAVQNLIHKDSIFSQLVDGRAQFLIKRRVQGPIPAIRDFDYEKQPPTKEFPLGRNVITHGTATWAGMDLVACQHLIDTEGIDAFLTERQQKVDLVVQGAIFPEWDERFHVITESEFKRYYGPMVYADPEDPHSPLKLPETWNLGRGLDWGTTLGHPSACIGVARPYETHSLSDSVFGHLELTMPAFPFKARAIPVTPRRLKKAILKAYGRALDKRVEQSAMSHEASAAFNTFMHDALEDGELLYFNKWKAQKGSGVPQIQNQLEIIPEPHPLRRYPKGYKIKGRDVGGQPLWGRPRFFLIVPDDQGELFVDDQGELRVRGAVDARGFARLRYEFPRYRNPVTPAGQEKVNANPKAHGEDDAIDALRGIANLFFPPPLEMTRGERMEALLPDNLKSAKIQERRERGEDVQGAHAARQHKLAKLTTDLTKNDSYSPLAKYRQRLKNRR